LRYLFDLLAPAGARGRLSILIFHRVLKEPDPLLPGESDVADFEARMRWVRSWFNVVPLSEAVERMYSGSLPARALSVTFDDGYADNAEQALPILERLGMTATFFVATGFLSGGAMWNDRVIEAVRQCRSRDLDLTSIGLGRLSLESLADQRFAVTTLLNGIKHRRPPEREAAVAAVAAAAGCDSPPSLMMNPDQVRRLARRGMDVGAHTVTHPILSRLDPSAARNEIGESKLQLEGLLGRPVSLFAYPNGVPGRDYAAEHVAIVRECGFTAAVSTAWGSATARADRFQLPRFTPWDRSRLRYGGRLAWNLLRDAQASV
jgi:peptidoglycan/xylan/chitin deacetylase (PgdA/CDA1 family)